MSLTLLLVFAFGGAILTYLLGKISSRMRDVFAVLISLALVLIVVSLHGEGTKTAVLFSFLNESLVLRLNMLSWLFAITIVSIGALSIIFSLSYMRGKEKTDFYYFAMLLVNASMLGIVLSGDLISFFIFWEFMSWSTFLLISYKRGPALDAGMKYMVMSILGSGAMLIGMLSLYASYETLMLSELATRVPAASSGYILFILTMFCVAFGIKNAIVPFHPWLPPAHSEAPSPFSAVLSGVLIKMGTYGFVLFLYVLVGLKIFSGLVGFQYILLVLGAVTIIVPSFIALLQDDAKMLLAWSTAGQAGYIIIGIALGTNLSVAGGLFHFLNHAIFKALLFLVVGAVEYRTGGIRDLNSLGGLVKRMPFTFLAVLVGGCGLIGIPLTNGFVSKWLIYKSLIIKGNPILAFVALVGTWGTVLYCYKLIHNVFLGQLPKEYEKTEKAPWSMRLPMIVLSCAVLLFGIVPGIPLQVINSIGCSFGFNSLDITIWGIASETGALNTVNIFAALLLAGIIVWLIFKASGKAVPVAQEDTYAAGASIPENKYHYTVNFFNPLQRMIDPFLKDFIDVFYMKLAGWTQNLSSGVRRIYSGYVGHYLLYIVLFVAVLIFIQVHWGLW